MSCFSSSEKSSDINIHRHSSTSANQKQHVFFSQDHRVVAAGAGVGLTPFQATEESKDSLPRGTWRIEVEVRPKGLMNSAELL